MAGRGKPAVEDELHDRQPDPYKRLLITIAIAPVFASAFLHGGAHEDSAWTDYDDLAESIDSMASAIARRLR